MALGKLHKLKGFGHKVVTFPPPKRSDAIGCVIVMLRRQYESLVPLASHLLLAANGLDWNKNTHPFGRGLNGVSRLICLFRNRVYDGTEETEEKSHRFNGTSPSNADCSLRQI